jgi:hypothetical protein
MNETIPNTETLEKEGWSKQFAAGEPRLSAAVEAYKEAGFDVYLEPLPKEPTCDSCEGLEEADECRICFEGFEDLYKTIYTRPKEGSTESNDDLF